MTNIITQFNLESLVENWLKQESEGVQFPVDFDTAWKVAGYSRKSVAKRRLAKMVKNQDYTISTDECKTLYGGRFSESIKFTCDAFKHFCLLAETDQGREIRQYFIECEKKWKIVEQQFPKVAESVEEIRAKQALALTEAQERLALAQREAAIAQEKAAKAQQSLIANKNALLVSDPSLYQVIVDNLPLAEIGGVGFFQKQIKEVHTPISKGISLTQFMSEIGGFERTKGGNFKQSDRIKVKALLKELGIDLETGDNCVEVERINTDYAIPEDKKNQAKIHVKTVLRHGDPNLLEILFNQ